MVTPLRRPAAPGRHPRFKLPSWQTLVVGLLALGGVNLLIIGFAISQDSEDTPVLHSKVTQVIPAPNSVIRPQEDIGADLDDDYIGVLKIDGVDIPEDQLELRPALGQVLFRPGDGKEIERLAPGRHRAEVQFWPQDTPRQNVENFIWEFTAG
jgi:hypothetical protein